MTHQSYPDVDAIPASELACLEDGQLRALCDRCHIAFIGPAWLAEPMKPLDDGQQCASCGWTSRGEPSNSLSDATESLAHALLHGADWKDIDGVLADVQYIVARERWKEAGLSDASTAS